MNTTRAEINRFRKNTIDNCIALLDLKKAVKVFGFELRPTSKCIIDCPKRDRAIWVADLFVSGPAASKYLKNGFIYWRNSLLVIAARQYASGKLPACINLKLGYRFLSPFSEDYTMWWIISAADYIDRTKDKFFKEVFVRVLKKALEYLETRINNNEIYISNLINYDWNWTIMRPRNSVLANILFYKVLTIAKKYGVKTGIHRNEFRRSLINTFWNNDLQAFADKSNVIYLDANSLAIVFGLCNTKRAKIILQTLEKLNSKDGTLSYWGKPKSFFSWHRDLISPFSAYLYCLALIKTNRELGAKKISTNNLKAGIAISKEKGLNTIPEFWKGNGKVVTPPASREGEYAVSFCHAWSTFGDIAL